jgi:hypothetical protein
MPFPVIESISSVNHNDRDVNTFNVPLPTETSNGDKLVFMVQTTTETTGTNTSFTNLQGFELVEYDETGEDSNGGHVLVWIMVKEANDEPSGGYDFQISGNHGALAGVMMRVVGAILPKVASSSDADLDGPEVRAPSVDIPVEDTLLIYTGAARGRSTTEITTPSGMSLVHNHHTTRSGHSNNGCRQIVAAQEISNTGSTGSRSGICNFESARWAAGMIALAHDDLPFPPTFSTSVYRTKLGFMPTPQNLDTATIHVRARLVQP